MKKLLVLFTAAAALLAVLALPSAAAPDARQAEPSVYDIAKDASKGRFFVDRDGGDFDILVLALKITGLDKAVDDPDADLTVFAPTDQAFRDTFGGRSELGVLIRTLKAVNFDLDTLRTVLLYHVTGLNTDGEKGLSSDEVLAATAGGPVDVPMLAGGNTVASNPPLQIDGANSAPSSIDAVDIGRGVASNGIIHVIGGVLLP